MVKKELLPRDPYLYNGLALAYMGDAVFEVYVRRYLFSRGETKAQVMHKQATKFVSAKAQARIIHEWLAESILSERELELVRRGRNAKINTAPKHTELSIYRLSTAFESLIGYLYLNEEIERMEELIYKGIDSIEKGGHDLV